MSIADRFFGEILGLSAQIPPKNGGLSRPQWFFGGNCRLTEQISPKNRFVLVPPR